MSAPPDGTRPWRKSWRKRWREGSSWRNLSPLARLVVLYVEQNADDDGHVTTTMRYLAKMMSPTGRGHTPVSHVTIWRAVKEAVSEGLLATEVVAKVKQNSERTPQQGPTRITRLNFRKYQEGSGNDETGSETDLVANVKRSSRSMQMNAEEAFADASRSPPVLPGLPVEDAPPEKPEPRRPNGKAANPRHAPMVGRLCQTFSDLRGEPYGFTPRDAKAVTGLLALGDDEEILRRWTAALSIPGFYRCDSLHELAAKWNAYGVGGSASQVVPISRSRPHRDGWEDAPRSTEWRDEQGRTLKDLMAQGRVQ